MDRSGHAVAMYNGWGSWTLAVADVDLDGVVAEALDRVPSQDRSQVRGLVEEFFEALDAALFLDAPQLLAEHLKEQRVRLKDHSTALDRNGFVRTLCEVLGSHLSTDTRTLINSLVTQSILWGGQRQPHESEQIPGKCRGQQAVHAPLVADLLEDLSDGRYASAQRSMVRHLEEGMSAPEVFDCLALLVSETRRRMTDGSVPETCGPQVARFLLNALALVLPPRLSVTGRTRCAVWLSTVPPGAALKAEVGPAALEMDGWKVTALPVGAMDDAALEAVAAQDTDLVVIDIDDVGLLRRSGGLVERLRRQAPGTAILLTGSRCALLPGLAERLGADLSAPTASTALAAASLLVPQSTTEPGALESRS